MIVRQYKDDKSREVRKDSKEVKKVEIRRNGKTVKKWTLQKHEHFDQSLTTQSFPTWSQIRCVVASKNDAAAAPGISGVAD